MLVSDRKRADFSSKDMVQDLNRLLRAKKGETVASNTLPELDKQVNKSKSSLTLNTLTQDQAPAIVLFDICIFIVIIYVIIICECGFIVNNTRNEMVQKCVLFKYKVKSPDWKTASLCVFSYIVSEQ